MAVAQQLAIELEKGVKDFKERQREIRKRVGDSDTIISFSLKLS